MSLALPNPTLDHVRQAHRLGAKSLRFDGHWDLPLYFNNTLKPLLAETRRLGMARTVVLGSGHPSHGGVRHMPSNAAQIVAASAWFVDLARFDPDATLELFNEPNYAAFWDNPSASVYNKAALGIVAAVRKAGLTNPFIGPSVARDAQSLAWTQAALGNGLLAKLAGVSVHWYDSRCSVAAAMMQTEKELRPIIGSLPIVYTEFGAKRDDIPVVMIWASGSVNLLSSSVTAPYLIEGEARGYYVKKKQPGLITHAFEAWCDKESLLAYGIDDDSQRFATVGPEWRTFVATGVQGKQGRVGQAFIPKGFPGKLLTANPRSYSVAFSQEVQAALQAQEQERRRLELGDGGHWYTMLDHSHPGFGIAPSIMDRLTSAL